MLLRLIIWGVLIYFVYRFFSNFFAKFKSPEPPIKGQHQQPAPPPYDPNQVEDIPYVEVKKKDDDHDPSE